jgi:hypothetical protein
MNKIMCCEYAPWALTLNHFTDVIAYLQARLPAGAHYRDPLFGISYLLLLTILQN